MKKFLGFFIFLFLTSPAFAGGIAPPVPAPVPEPSSIIGLVVGITALFIFRKKLGLSKK